MEVMRRTKHLQVILLIICFLAFGSGCSSKNNPSVSEPIVSGTVETQPPTDTQQPVQNWDISQNHSAALIPGAYVLDEIPVPLRGIISSLSQKGTRALAVVSSFQQSGGQSDTLTVYDLSVKQAVWEMELEEGFTGAGFLSDGSVCAYWSSMEKLCVYGPEGQLLYIYDGIRLEGNPYIDDAQGIWLINGGELLHLCGGNKHTYPISFTGIAQTVVSVRSGRVLYACRQDSDCGAFADTVTGEQNWLPRMEGFSAGDGLFYKASEDRFLYSLDGEQIFSIPLLTEDEIIDAAVLGDQIVIRTLQKFYFLNLKTHSLAQLDGQAYYTGIFAGQTDALLLRLMTAQGEQVCSLTDYTEGQTDVSVTEQLLTPEQLRNREKAEAIEEMYGIYVRWLPQPAGTLASSGSRRSEGDQTDADIAEF